jgi:hypothetical protein
MKKLGILLRRSVTYAMLSEASIRSDMAKRIMHSLLPAVADPNQVATTKGAVDYTSLATAAEGRSGIIKYGTMACVEELRHLLKTPNQDYDRITNPVPYHRALALAKEGKYLEAINDCVEGFSMYEYWAPAYGGKAWEKIAKVIHKLIELDMKLEKLRTNKADPDFVDSEIETLNDIVIYMNVFDGLAHNTGSIMGKLVNEEVKDLKLDYTVTDRENKAVERLMHAKELKNPFHVYKEVAPTLKETGDIHRYKDWAGKLRAHPDFNVKSDEHEINIGKIDIHKKTMAFIKTINDEASKLHTILEEGKQTSSIDMYTRATIVINLMENIGSYMTSTVYRVEDMISDNQYTKNQDFLNYFNAFKDSLSHDKNRAINVRDMYYSLVGGSKEHNIQEILKSIEKFYAICKDFLDKFREH